MTSLFIYYFLPEVLSKGPFSKTQLIYIFSNLFMYLCFFFYYSFCWKSSQCYLHTLTRYLTHPSLTSLVRKLHFLLVLSRPSSAALGTNRPRSLLTQQSRIRLPVAASLGDIRGTEGGVSGWKLPLIIEQ